VDPLYRTTTAARDARRVVRKSGTISRKIQAKESALDD
jgi:hypothetical protein